MTVVVRTSEERIINSSLLPLDNGNQNFQIQYFIILTNTTI
jgi:hypothetical protein